MKKLILVFLALIATSVMADEKSVQDKFNQHKALTLEALSEREVILQQEKECVVKSQKTEEIKGCFKQASKNRKEFGVKLREKMGK